MNIAEVVKTADFELVEQMASQQKESAAAD
jgi:hypothetical protein